MATSDWWISTTPEELCQGDIIPNVPFYVCRSPLTHVKHLFLKGGRDGWEKVDKPTLNKNEQKCFILAASKSEAGILISHGCEIDKEHTSRLLLAPVMRIDTLPERMRSIVLNQQSHSMMVLPDVPDHGDCFADLRLITAILIELVETDARICSMTDDARLRLQAQLVNFFLRKELPETVD